MSDAGLHGRYGTLLQSDWVGLPIAFLVTLVGPLFLIAASVEPRLPTEDPSCFESCLLNYDRTLLAVQTLAAAFGYLGIAVALVSTGAAAFVHLGRIVRWVLVAAGAVAMLLVGRAVWENVDWWLDGSIHGSTTHAALRGIAFILIHLSLLVPTAVFAAALSTKSATVTLASGPWAFLGVLVALYITAFVPYRLTTPLAMIVTMHLATWVTWAWTVWLGPRNDTAHERGSAAGGDALVNSPRPGRGDASPAERGGLLSVRDR